MCTRVLGKVSQCDTSITADQELFGHEYLEQGPSNPRASTEALERASESDDLRITYRSQAPSETKGCSDLRDYDNGPKLRLPALPE